MTVAELMEILQQMSQDKEVWVSCYTEPLVRISGVYILEKEEDDAPPGDIHITGPY